PVGSEGLPGVTRSFGSFDAAAAEAGQSRIYGGIHFSFDSQNGLASGHSLGQFVVGSLLLPAAGEDGADSRHDDHPTGGRAAFGAEGLALLLAGASNASAANGGVLGGPHSAPAIGQPTKVLATPVDKDQPIQHAGAWDRLAGRGSDLRVLDQAWAGLDDSTFAGPFQGDEVSAWAR